MEVLYSILKLFIATALAAVVGYEREVYRKPAGIRTMMLVGLGSCLFMVISAEAVKGVPGADPGRIAAQVVTGIGFLGAGTIIRAGGSVVGLTTAASIWLVAAVGLAVGAGLYGPAVVSTAMGFAILRVVERYFEKYKRPPQPSDSDQESSDSPLS